MPPIAACVFLGAVTFALRGCHDESQERPWYYWTLGDLARIGAAQ